MTTEKKLPEWWAAFCEAVKTRTLDQYEARSLHWKEPPDWHRADGWVEEIYKSPTTWHFRKKQRTVNIDGVDVSSTVGRSSIKGIDWSLVAKASIPRIGSFSAGSA